MNLLRMFVCRAVGLSFPVCTLGSICGQFIIAHMPQIEHLCMDAKLIQYDWTAMEALSTCSTLTSLQIDLPCGNLTNELLERLCALQHITALILRFIPRVRIVNISRLLLHWLPQLTSLDMWNDAKLFDTLGEYMLLHSLKFNKMRTLYLDRDVPHHSGFLQSLACFPQLSEFTLRLDRRHMALGDVCKLLQSISQMWSGTLVSLNLYFCQYDQQFWKLLTYLSSVIDLPKLETLMLSFEHSNFDEIDEYDEEGDEFNECCCVNTIVSTTGMTEYMIMCLSKLISRQHSLSRLILCIPDRFKNTIVTHLATTFMNLSIKINSHCYQDCFCLRCFIVRTG